MTEPSEPSATVGENPEMTPPEVASPEMPEESISEVRVGLERSVRYTRLMLVGAVTGAILAVLVTVSQPLGPEALYTMGQIAGFMLIIGAVAGLTLGVLLGLILNRFARRKRGSGVAIHADVQ